MWLGVSGVISNKITPKIQLKMHFTFLDDITSQKLSITKTEVTEIGVTTTQLSPNYTVMGNS